MSLSIWLVLEFSFLMSLVVLVSFIDSGVLSMLSNLPLDDRLKILIL